MKEKGKNVAENAHSYKTGTVCSVILGEGSLGNLTPCPKRLDVPTSSKAW